MTSPRVTCVTDIWRICTVCGRRSDRRPRLGRVCRPALAPSDRAVTVTARSGSVADMSVDPENGSRDLIPRIWIPDPFVRIKDPTLTVCRQIHWDHRSSFAIRQEVLSDPRSKTPYCVGISVRHGLNNPQPGPAQAHGLKAQPGPSPFKSMIW